MATSTLIQYLEPKDTDGVALPGGVSHRRQVETYLVTLTNAGGVPATLTIPAGSWMAWDTSQSGASAALFVTEAANVALGNPLVCGVLLRAASATVPASSSVVVKGEVVVAGFVDAEVDGAVVAGSPLTVDTTVGRAHVAVTGDIDICGVALGADVANMAPVMVFKKF